MDEEPLQSSPTETRSKFTWKQLSGLSSGASARENPLKVIAHVDLDAFYAQVEGVRLGTDPRAPLAVQQWQGLIAINYPAREFGISRHETAPDALRKCPELILAHVQTWKEGDDKPEYHKDPQPTTHKVSLDPYRRESRRILAIFQQACDKVEKASIDESFLDLSSAAKARLLLEYPYLSNPPTDLNQPLPPPPSISWTVEHGLVIPLDAEHSEEEPNDWDDVILKCAAEIIRELRTAVFDQLGYTCSAGIACNKILSKLGSGKNKPNKQTVLRNRAVMDFLKTFKFTKIRNLGGKMGDQVAEAYNTDEVDELRKISLNDLKNKFGDEFGTWVYQIVRGIDNSEVNPRTQIKSMLSSKNFRPCINSMDQAKRWTKILIADIASRLAEDPLARRPKTLTVHHRAGAISKSRQIPIPLGRALEKEYLFELSCSLLRTLESEARPWPCQSMAFGVQGFEEPEGGVRGIAGFLTKKELHSEETGYGPNKKLKVDNDHDRIAVASEDLVDGNDDRLLKEEAPTKRVKNDENVAADNSVICEQCLRQIPQRQLSEHQDYHYARDLLQEDRKERKASSEPSKPKTYGRNGKTKPATSSTDPPERTMISRMFGKNTQRTESRTKVAQGPLTQLHLDLVNSRVTCPQCRMSYTRGSADDEQMHKKFHSKTLTGVEVTFGKETCFQTPIWSEQESSDSVYMISPDPTRSGDWRKALELLEIVNTELSAAAVDLNRGKYKVFVFVRKKKIVAMLLAEPIKSAFITEQAQELSSAVSFDRKPLPGYILGVSRVWTATGFRHQGIASMLLELARFHFIAGCQIDRKEVAFSQPSESGQRWAEKWLNQCYGHGRIAVYLESNTS